MKKNRKNKPAPPPGLPPEEKPPIKQLQKPGSFKQRVDFIAGPPNMRGIVFNTKDFERQCAHTDAPF